MRASPRFSIPRSEVDLEQLHCARAVVSCIDFRFREADRRFIDALGPEPYDFIKFAGAAKSLLKEPNRGLLLDLLRTVCREAHQVREIILLNHWDCAAYGFSKAFGSAAEEEQAHVADLRAAGAVLRAQFPDVQITLAYSRPTENGLEYFLLAAEGASRCGTRTDRGEP